MDQKSESCLFCLKIGTHFISRSLILVPTLVFWISKPKSIFVQIWTKKVKVVQFGWKLAHKVSWQCWLLFQHYVFQFPTLNPFLEKLGPKNWKWFILTEHWHTWYIEDVDCYSDNSFLNCYPYTRLWTNLGWKSENCLFCLKIGAHVHTHTQSISKMLILISILVSQIPNLNLFYGQIWVEKLEFFALPGNCYTEYFEDVIVRIQSKVWKKVWK